MGHSKPHFVSFVSFDCLVYPTGVNRERRLKTGEIADDLNVHTRTVSRMLDAGEIPYERAGRRGHRRVRESDYREFLKRYRKQSDRSADV